MFTLLDTNVVSELMRESPDQSVAHWVSGHPVEDLCLSAVSEAELRYGAAILPLGRRRETLFFTSPSPADTWSLYPCHPATWSVSMVTVDVRSCTGMTALMGML